MAANEDESSYGQPLWFDPQPRLIRADGTEGLAFENFLIGGDIETVYFRRWSRAAGEVVTETWTRTGTRTLQGRLVSVFNPTWAEWELWDTFIGRRRGFDKPLVDFGTIRIPSNGDPEDDDFEEMRIRLPVAPLNLPESRVQRIGDNVQYASHVVNMVVPEFGNDRVDGDDYAFQIEEVTKAFYEFFPDVYDSIAIVTAEQHPSSGFQAYHWNVRNPIEGLANWGTFDYTDRYGSRGALRSVEVYRDAGFTTAWLSNHEIGHQWADYWHWSKMAGFLQLAGWEPQRHTPLLYPGEVLLGSILLPSRRIALADDGEGDVLRHREHARPVPLPSDNALSHGTHRAGRSAGNGGLREPGAVQHGLAKRPGHRHRRRRRSSGGPHQRHHGRARCAQRPGGLVVAACDARSLAERTAVTPGDELLELLRRAARGAVRRDDIRRDATVLRSDRRPRDPRHDGRTVRRFAYRQRPAAAGVRRPDRPGEFRGVELDEEIPGSMTVGETIAFTGTITVAQAADIVEVCVEHWHAGGPPDDDGDEFRTSTTCGEPAGNRFDIPLRFDEAGRYGLAVLLKDQADGVTEPNVTRLSMISGITVL